MKGGGCKHDKNNEKENNELFIVVDNCDKPSACQKKKNLKPSKGAARGNIRL